MADLESAKARCPFYRKSGKGYIRCEGIACARSVTIQYRGERQRNRQMEIFCQACYTRCEIYRAIVESKGLDERDARLYS